VRTRHQEGDLGPGQRRDTCTPTRQEVSSACSEDGAEANDAGEPPNKTGSLFDLLQGLVEPRPTMQDGLTSRAKMLPTPVSKRSGGCTGRHNICMSEVC
jgi:hypothetical protein